MARRCIFCDGVPVTRAHVFRKDWIDKLYPEHGSLAHRHTRQGLGGDLDRPWSATEADLKVKAACGPCNSGWMNRLDHDAEGLFLNRAAIGVGVKLSRQSEMRLLAHWCCLIACLVDQTQAVPAIGSPTHHAVASGEVPDGVGIWLFQMLPSLGTVHVRADCRTLMSADTSVKNPRAYFLTFAVNQVVGQVFLPLADDFRVTTERRGDPQFYRRLWPAPLTPFFWPPASPMPVEAFDGLAGVFPPGEVGMPKPNP